MAFNRRLELRAWNVEDGYRAADIRTAPDETRTLRADEVYGPAASFAVGLGDFDSVVTARLEAVAPTVLRTFRCRRIPRRFYGPAMLAVVRVDGQDWIIDSVSSIGPRVDELILRQRSTADPLGIEDTATEPPAEPPITEPPTEPDGR